MFELLRIILRKDLTSSVLVLYSGVDLRSKSPAIRGENTSYQYHRCQFFIFVC